MRIVAKPSALPQHCAVLPHKRRDPDGFIDTGNTLPMMNDQVYISASAVYAMAKKYGLPGKGELEAAQSELKTLRTKVSTLETALSKANSHLEAIHGLKARGWTESRKPGKKAKESV